MNNGRRRIRFTEYSPSEHQVSLLSCHARFNKHRQMIWPKAYMWYLCPTTQDSLPISPRPCRGAFAVFRSQRPPHPPNFVSQSLRYDQLSIPLRILPLRRNVR